MEKLINYRSFEVEEKDDKKIIYGYGIVFNTLSEDMGNFREMVLPEAVTQELINKSDIYFLWNHKDTSYPLARSKYGKGSMKLTIDSIGLRYEFECLNEEFYKLCKRGDIDSASFAFYMDKNKDVIWERSEKYNQIAKIKYIDEMADISAVLIPAYKKASTNARSLTPPTDEVQEQPVEVKPINEEQPIQEPEKPIKEEEPETEKPVEEPVKEEVKEEAQPEPEKEIDYSAYDNVINSLKK